MAALILSAAPAFAAAADVEWSADSMVTPVSCDNSCDPCCGDSCGCGSEVAASGIFSGIGPGIVENFSLASLLGLECSSIEVGGWTQFGYHDNVTPLSTVPGEGLSFNDVPDNVNLQQQWFYVGRTADGSNGADLGFRADFVYGTDAQKTQAFGNPAGSWDIDWDHGVYGWAIPQLYGEVAVGDMAVKIGHFFTPVGYEVVPATGNFFYSHAYTMFNSEPFTHTGVLSTYTGIENLTVYNGWTLGWDTGFDNLNQGSNYLGGFGANLGENVTFTYICTYGNFGAISAGGNDYSHSMVANLTLTDKLTYVAQSDYKKVDNTDDEDVGLNQYLFYAWRDNVKLGTRIEWWRDNQVSHAEYTSGANIQLLGNMVIRPEYRKDWLGGFDEDTVACDLILTY